MSVFESWGYARIITPLFECADVLERGLGEDARAAAIRFVEPGTGEVVALRPDITPQVARIAATRMHDVVGPMRFCYDGAVTRSSNGARGQREILQAGAELVDAPSPDGDAEIIAVAAAALATVGVDDVRLDLGHVALARHALSAVVDPEQRAAVRLALAKKNRAAVKRAADGLDADLAAKLEALPTLFGPPADTLARARALGWPDDVASALDTLEAVLGSISDVVEDQLHSSTTVDLGEIRGFEYYTGIRFAGFAPGVGEAVLRGGRYDELVARYGRSAPATGFAVDIEAIAQAQRSAGMQPPEPDGRVLVASVAERRAEAMRVAAALRSGPLSAAVHIGDVGDAAALLAYAIAVGFSSAMIFQKDGVIVVDVDGSERQVSSDALAAASAGDASILTDLVRRR
jgi:ATP phosphoribosyltransferase regulatory subunit